MRKLVVGLLSWVGAGVWWIVDRLWGDAVFAAVRPMIPDWLADASQAWPLAMDWAVSYGPPAALFALGGYFFWTGRRAIRDLVGEADTRGDLSEHIPNLRVADRHFARKLFEQPQSDALIPLLEAEKVASWGRPMGPGEPPPIKIPGTLWRTHTLHFVAGRDQWAKSQTYLKSNGRQDTAYYDIFLNTAQIEKIWSQTRADKVRELDDLFAEGTNRRNYLRTAPPNIGFSEFQYTFDRWNGRVIAVLDSFSVADKSRFRTLNLFEPKNVGSPPNEPDRRRLEAIWNEKLDRLSAIIAQSGE